VTPFVDETDPYLRVDPGQPVPRRRWPITAWLPVLVLLPLLVMSTFIYVIHRRSHVRELHDRLEGIASVRESWLLSHLDGKAARLRAAAVRPRLLAATRSWQATGAGASLTAARRSLEDALAADPQLLGARLLDADGGELVTVGRTWGAASVRAMSPEPSLVRLDSVPVAPGVAEVWGLELESDGQRLGSLQLWVSGQALLRLAGDSVNLGETGETVLGYEDAAGTLRFIGPPRFGGYGPLMPVGPTQRLPLEEAIAGEEGVRDDLTDYRGEPVVAATRHIDGTGWGLVVKLDRSEGFAPLTAFATIFAIGLALIGAVVFLVAVVIARRLRAGEKKLADANRRLRSTLLSSPFPAMVHAEDGEVLLVSDSWVSRTGYERDELTDLDDWTRRAYGESAGDVRAHIDTLFDAGGPVDDGAYRVRTRDGTELIWEFRSMPLGRLPDGRQTVLSMAVDITERIRAEEALKRSQELLLETGEMARVGGWEVDPDTGRVRWSEVTRSIHEVEDDFDPSLEDAYAFFPGEARDRIAEAVERAIEAGTPYDLALPFETAQGEARWVHTVGQPEFEDGRCVRLHGTIQDITERREREAELERLNRALAFVSASNAALVRGGEDLNLSERVCEVAIETGGYAHVWIGYQDDDDEPLRVFQAGHSERIDLFGLAGLRQEIEAAESAGLAFVTRGLDQGAEPWEERLARRGYATLAVLPFPTDIELEGFVAFAHTDPQALDHDEIAILEELVADLAYGLWVQSMRQELLLIRHAVANLSVGVSIVDATDPQMPLVYVNQGFSEVTGYSAEEVRGRYCGDLLQGPDTDPATRAEIETAFEARRSFRGTVLNYRKSGEPFWNRLTLEPARNANGEVTHFVAFQEDVTEQRRLRKELQHRSRLSAIGELAGGVAHDFRNILTAAQGLLEVSLSDARLDGEAAESLDDLHDLIERGTAITERLLALSRRAESDVVPVRLSRIVSDTATLIEHTIRDDIEVVAEDAEEAVHVRLDEDQFTTVILNLARNAAQAMPDGGTLALELQHPVVAGAPRWWPPDLEPDSERPWVRLSVRDTGEGMDARTLEHAFDPYFTTKAAGEGTGLGLAMVHGVVEGWGGRVWIESQPGEGTTVHILLPTVDAVEVDVEATEPASPDAAEPRTGTILLAEDDATVLKVFRKGLEGAGHTVLSGQDGAEALEAFERDPSAVDLVVTDGFMPRISGGELGRAVWERRPDLTVVVTSGFDSEDIRSEFPDDPPGDLVFLPKPLSIDELLEAVQRLLPPARDETP
jgi:PAS domain S-box-containing protein